MSAHTAEPAVFNTAEPAVLTEVTYLEKVRDDRGQKASTEGQLRLEVATERNANKAMLAAILELDSRLATERSAGKAMLAAVGELERRLDAERESVVRWEAWAVEAERILADNIREQESSRSWWRRLRDR